MYFEKTTDGWLEVICGPMFAGKTEELLRRLKRLEYAHIDYLLFKPKIDTRYGKNKVVAHSGIFKNSIDIHKSYDIYNYINNENIKVIAIDEVQFLDEDIVDICENLCKKGYRIIVNGLDLDFRSEPFIVVSKLLSKAEFVTKLKSICVKCGLLASRTQRLVNNEPASYNNDIVLVGSSETYEARCRHCYELIKK